MAVRLVLEDLGTEVVRRADRRLREHRGRVEHLRHAGGRARRIADADDDGERRPNADDDGDADADTDVNGAKMMRANEFEFEFGVAQ